MAAWPNWSAEQRREAVVIRDEGVIAQLHAHMRGLWEAEIQARELGISGMVSPFDQSKLPLLSSMEFDGTTSGGVQSFHSVKWPMEFFEDPRVLPDAVKSAIGTCGDKASRKVARDGWRQILKPSPRTWVEFERLLAKLVEQVLIEAVAEGGAPEGGAPEGGTREVGPAIEAGCGNKAAAPVQSAARAAKRARQRERRKLGRQGITCNDGEGNGTTPAPISASTSTLNPLAPSWTPSTHRVGAPMRVDTDKLCTDSPEPLKPVAPAQAMAAGSLSDPITLPLLEAPRGSGGATNLGTFEDLPDLGAFEDWQDYSPAPLSMEPAMEPSEPPPGPWEPPAPWAPAGPDTAADEDADDELAEEEIGVGAAVPALAAGRGRPLEGSFIQGLADDDEMMTRGRGFGRGTPLKYPPGLSRPGQRVQPPGGLSQVWEPAPAILEDEEFDGTPGPAVFAASSLLQQSLAPVLPPGKSQRLGVVARGRPGRQISGSSDASGAGANGNGKYSAPATPAMYWSHTPSPPCSPALRPAHGLPQPRHGEPAPSYVWVPATSALSCPHCGCAFALLPDALTDVPSPAVEPTS